MTQDKTVGVRYIGRKAMFTDNLYGSRLTFTSGQMRAVPESLAGRFLRHADSFEACEVATPKRGKAAQDDTADLLETARVEQEANDKQRDDMQDLRDQIGQMDKDALEIYARTNFRQDLDKRHSIAALRQQVTGFIDQFGVA